MPETTKKKSDFLTNWLKKTIYVDRGPRGQVGFRKIYRKSHLVGGDWNMNSIDNLYIYRIYSWLVVWNHGMLWLSIIILGISMNFIIPTDEVIFFRGVGQPPTRYVYHCTPIWKKRAPWLPYKYMGWYTRTYWEPFVPYQWSMARRVKCSWIPSSPSRTWLLPCREWDEWGPW